MNAKSSIKPYLIRAVHQWCSDNGLTPQILVQCDDTVVVPPHHIQNGEIVLNIANKATGNLKLGDDSITFQARFGGVVWDLFVPVCRITGIFSRETSEGTILPLDKPNTPAKKLNVVENVGADNSVTAMAAPDSIEPNKTESKKPSLRVVK